MKVLVTGGSGFIGKHLVSKLTAAGNTVDIYSRLKGRDIRDYDSLLSAVDGKDLVFHLAGVSSTKVAEADPQLDATVSVLGTLNVLMAARKHGSRVVFASSPYVIGRTDTERLNEQHPTNPSSNYGVSKLACENYCKKSSREGVKVTVARLFNAYGPGQGPGFIIPDILSKVQSPVMELRGTGHEVRDYISVWDVCDALLFLSESGGVGEVYNVGTGVPTSTRELAEQTCLTAGSRAKVVFLGTTEGDFGQPRYYADISKIRSIGWAPKVSLQEGLKRTVQNYTHKQA